MTESAIHFEVEGLPIAKARPKATTIGGFARMYTPKKSMNYEAWVRGCAAAAMKGRKPFEGACEMAIRFNLPVPSSWPNWKQEAALDNKVKPTGRPDLDNMVKSVKDACNSVVFKDDAQIITLETSKTYSAMVGCRVWIHPVEEIASAVEWKAHLEQLRFEEIQQQEPKDLFGDAA